MRLIQTFLIFLVAFNPAHFARADSTNARTAVSTAQSIPTVIQTYLGNPNSTKGCSTDSQVDCLDLYENFCKKLYAPGNEGNISLRAGDKQWDIQLGKTKTGLDNSFVALAKAKIFARESLPADFRKYLEKEGYFQKLQKYLNGKAKSEESLEEQNEDALLASALSSIWNNSITAAARERTDKIHPGYHSLTYIPPTWDKDATKISDELTAEIHGDIWKNNPKWKEIENSFALVKAEYLKMLRENTKLTPEVKKDWIARISTVALSLPGADPKDQGDDADACATTENNAFYSPSTHSLTVCAGDFNSMDQLLTMGHEISHSLDPGTTALLQQLGSDLGKGLQAVQKQLCDSTSPACPSAWTALKSQFNTDLANFPLPIVQNEAFLSCLKSQEASDPINPETIKDSAKSDATEKFSDNADSHFFLDLSIPELTLNDGRSYPNPGYLKPYCDVQDRHFRLTASSDLGTIFAAEYACGDSQKPQADRLSAAMASAKDYYQQITEKAIPLGGKFSTNEEMVNAGFAENVKERFADSMGLRVSARIIKSQKYPSIEQKRDEFLSAAADMCDPPSDETKYPAEATVEKAYSTEPHSLNSARRHEYLIQPIREAIDCKLDDESLTRDCNQI
jgi:hypothetical protein